MSACQWCKGEGASLFIWRGEREQLCQPCAALRVEGEVLRATGGEPYEFADLARRTRERLGKKPGPPVKSPAELEFDRVILRNGWGQALKEIEEERARHASDED